MTTSTGRSSRSCSRTMGKRSQKTTNGRCETSMSSTYHLNEPIGEEAAHSNHQGHRIHLLRNSIWDPRGANSGFLHKFASQMRTAGHEYTSLGLEMDTSE
eukprot:12935186-Prorocentrum_lima.AAC.1